MRNVAADLLHDRMQLAFNENPRGEMYRTIPQDKLLDMLAQNLAEVRLALQYGNDVEDKLADCGNYIAFILRNHMDPLVEVKQDTLLVSLIGQLRGTQLSPQQADALIAVIKTRVRP